MEFLTEFRRTHTKEQQTQESQRLRHKYPERLPILVDRVKKSAPLLDKHKFLVPTDLTFGQFVYVVRKRLSDSVKPHDALYFYVNHHLIPVSQPMTSCFKEHSENGYLIVTYGTEETFGTDAPEHPTVPQN